MHRGGTSFDASPARFATGPVRVSACTGLGLSGAILPVLAMLN